MPLGLQLKVHVSCEIRSKEMITQNFARTMQFVYQYSHEGPSFLFVFFFLLHFSFLLVISLENMPNTRINIPNGYINMLECAG